MSVNEDLLSKWRKEQHEIASKIIVPPDDEMVCTKFGITSSRQEDGGDPSYYGHEYISYDPMDIHDKFIGGVDVSFGKDDTAVAVYVITRNLEVVYKDSLMYTLNQPYVSSYLAFREIEPLTDLIRHQMENHPKLTPEVIIVDGNGVWHERSAGIACFVGVRTNIPAIGVGKTPYCCDGWRVDLMEDWIASSVSKFVNHCHEIYLNGDGDGEEKATERNNSEQSMIVQCSATMDADECNTFFQNNDDVKDCGGRMKEMVNIASSHCMGFAIPFKGKSGCILGAAMVGHGGRTQHISSHKGGHQRQGRQHKQSGTKVPIYISVGHGISVQRAIALCAALSIHRIPEPVRQADLIGRQIMREKSTSRIMDG